MFPDNKLLLIAGPCVIEDHTVFETAQRLKEIVAPFASSVHWIFKSSYDKANRSSLQSYRGPGLKLGLQTLAKIKESLDVEILTDVHSPEEAREAAKVCDIIQVPAFLCRQTDLLVTAGETQAIVNIKKGQFLSPWDMQGPIDKVLSTGNVKLFSQKEAALLGIIILFLICALSKFFDALAFLSSLTAHIPYNYLGLYKVKAVDKLSLFPY